MSLVSSPIRVTFRAIGAISLVIAALGLSGSLAAPAGAQAQPTPAFVTLVHGVRGLVADVYLDGQLALPAFQPLRSTDPIALPPGPHMVDVRTAGAAATSTPLLHTTVTLTSGARQSAVVHLDAAGNPTASLYTDDISAVPPGTSRFVVRHAAAAGPIAVLVDTQTVASGLENGQEAKQAIAAGSHQVSVLDPSTKAALAPPEAVNFAEGSANFMYLIGSNADNTLGWAVVNVPGLQTAPTRVQTGDGSVAFGAPAGLRPISVLALALGVVALALTGAWAVLRSRSQPRAT
jgi:hypothetical protein